MNCPICIVPLNVAERQGVEIDFCPKCRGVWLDRGELDKIIERSTLETPSRPYSEQRYNDGQSQQPYDKHHDEHRSEHHQKKRGFLHDLFD